jgi:hypothetical protein
VPEEALPAGVVRAALAFSALSTFQADSIQGRLRPRDRARLRAGLLQVRGATIDERRAALNTLVKAARRGVEWKAPAAHDPSDCPFRIVESFRREEVVKVMERMAGHRPLHVAVALCHIDANVRADLWRRMNVDARSNIVIEVPGVPTVSAGRSRAFARELQSALIGE